MQDPFFTNQVSRYISMYTVYTVYCDSYYYWSIETESLTITFVTCITHPFVTDADSSHLLLWTGNWTNMWWHLFNVCVCVYITPAYNHWFCFLYMHVLVKYTHLFRKNLGYVVMVCLNYSSDVQWYIYYPINCKKTLPGTHGYNLCSILLLSGNYYIFYLQ